MLTLALALALQTVPQPAPAPAPTAPTAADVAPDAEDEAEFFGLFDTDKDGAISRAEFDTVSASVDAEAAKEDPGQKGQVAAGLGVVFPLMDTDKDGRITRAEFRALTAMGGKTTMDSK